MGELNKLEQRVEEEKSVKQTNSSISAFENKCIELLDGLSLSTIEQTEEGWRNLKNLFESAKGTCTLEQISQVQNFLSNVHFHIIKTKMVANQGEINLRDEIEEQEQAEMKSTMYYHATELLSSTNGRKKEFGEKIKTSMQLYSQAKQEDEVIYDKAIWNSFIEAEGTVKGKQEEQHTSTALVLAGKKQNVFQRLWKSITGIKKSEIEKIAEEVVTDEMLDKFIDYNMPPSQRYVPDRRLPVYLMLQQLKELEREAESSISFDYVADNEISYMCHITYEDPRDHVPETNITFTHEGGRQITKRSVGYRTYNNPIRIIRFANFLGCGGRAKQEIGNFFITEQKDKFKEYYDVRFIKNLWKRLQRAMQEYDKEYFAFFTNEDERAKRAQTERQEFLDSLRATQKALGGQGTNLQQGEIKVDKEEKNGQMEVGE